MSFKASVSLLIFSPIDLSTDVSGLLKPPIDIVCLSFRPFMSQYLLYVFRYSDVGWIFILQLLWSSSWIDPLITMLSPSLSLVTVFILKYVSSDINHAALVFFWFLFAWNSFFHFLTFSLCVFIFEVNLLQATFICILFLYSFSHTMFFYWSI